MGERHSRPIEQHREWHLAAAITAGLARRTALRPLAPHPEIRLPARTRA
jgi:hypothetical protein